MIMVSVMKELKFQFTIMDKHEPDNNWTYINAFVTSRTPHCVKSVQTWSFFWSVFSCIWTEYRKIRTRKNFVFGHFLRSTILTCYVVCLSNLSKLLNGQNVYFRLKLRTYKHAHTHTHTKNNKSMNTKTDLSIVNINKI